MRCPFPNLLFAMAMAAALPGAARACGAVSDCPIPAGDYRIALPPGAPGPGQSGAIVFLHGYNSSPEEIMKFGALREVADRLGLALIVPRGVDKSWSLPGVFRRGRDDVAFVRSVVDDAEARFSIDPDRVMISGFSVGASMTWYVACAEGQGYAGYAPIAGSFWEPYVASCALPLPYIYHVHGLADTTVPMEGRRLSFATQGDTYKSFALLRQFSQCAAKLDPEPAGPELACAQQSCGGAAQELCLHDGAHSVEPAWIERAWVKLAKAKGWS